MYVRETAAETEGETERKSSSINWFLSKQLPSPGLFQNEAKNLEFHAGIPHEWQRHTRAMASRKLDQKQSSQNSNWSSNLGCRHHRQPLNPRPIILTPMKCYSKKNFKNRDIHLTTFSKVTSLLEMNSMPNTND